MRSCLLERCVRVEGGACALVVLYQSEEAGSRAVSTFALTLALYCVTDLAQVVDKRTISEVTYIAAHHDARVLSVGTVRAYYGGAKAIAEVDIVLPRSMPLLEARDIAWTLQRKLLRLPSIERAYVQLDYDGPHAAALADVSVSIADDTDAAAPQAGLPLRPLPVHASGGTRSEVEDESEALVQRP
jgi:hypothetical protein